MADGDAEFSFQSITGLSDVILTLFSDSEGADPVGSPVSMPETSTAGATGTYTATVLAADVPAGAAFWQPSSATLTDAGRSAFGIQGINFDGSGGGGGTLIPSIGPEGVNV